MMLGLFGRYNTDIEKPQIQRDMQNVWFYGVAVVVGVGIEQ